MVKKNRGGGRPTAIDENLRALVMDRAWFEIHTYLIDKNVKRADKVKFAIVLASKSVPQKIDADLKVSGICVSFEDGTKVEM